MILCYDIDIYGDYAVSASCCSRVGCRTNVLCMEFSKTCAWHCGVCIWHATVHVRTQACAGMQFAVGWTMSCGLIIVVVILSAGTLT